MPHARASVATRYAPRSGERSYEVSYQDPLPFPASHLIQASGMSRHRINNIASFGIAIFAMLLSPLLPAVSVLNGAADAICIDVSTDCRPMDAVGQVLSCCDDQAGHSEQPDRDTEQQECPCCVPIVANVALGALNDDAPAVGLQLQSYAFPSGDETPTGHRADSPLRPPIA